MPRLYCFAEFVVETGHAPSLHVLQNLLWRRGMPRLYCFLNNFLYFCGKLKLQSLSMSQTIKTITVYASASSRISPVYFEEASKLGELLAKNSITCVNGGGIKGLMAAITVSVFENGGNVCGVVPQFMLDRGWVHQSIREVIVTNDMHSRKKTMADLADAFIALPGGLGTFEELLEIITWKQLGLHSKPIVILNVSGFYDNLLDMLDKADRENFIHSKLSRAFRVASNAEEALKLVFDQSQEEDDFTGVHIEF